MMNDEKVAMALVSFKLDVQTFINISECRPCYQIHFYHRKVGVDWSLTKLATTIKGTDSIATPTPLMTEVLHWW